MLPNYIAKAVPNPGSNRAPWYRNTAPTYAGVFLWIVFYREIAAGTLDRANPAVCLAALVVAGVINYGLFYYVPALEESIIDNSGNHQSCQAHSRIGGVINYGLFYYVPALVGMRTGYPL